MVTRTFGGYVVEERFDGRPGIELHGMSVSLFDEHRLDGESTFEERWRIAYERELDCAAPTARKPPQRGKTR